MKRCKNEVLKTGVCDLSLIIIKRLLSTALLRLIMIVDDLRVRKIQVEWYLKSNLHYTCGITLMRVTSGGAHLRGLAPGLHSSEETSQRWRAVGNTVNLEIEPLTSRTDSVRLVTELTAV